MILLPLFIEQIAAAVQISVADFSAKRFVAESQQKLLDARLNGYAIKHCVGDNVHFQLVGSLDLVRRDRQPVICDTVTPVCARGSIHMISAQQGGELFVILQNLNQLYNRHCKFPPNAFNMSLKSESIASRLASTAS